MGRWLATSPLAPWSGLFVGALAWALDHQLSSDVNNWDCARTGGPWVVSVGVVCGLVAIAGGWLSWAARTPDGDPAGPTRAFGRIVGVLAAATFLLAIGFGTLAGLTIPGCYR